LNPEGVQFLHDGCDLSGGAAQPVDSPEGYYVKAAACSVFHEPVKLGALVPPCGTADALVPVFTDHLPAPILCQLLKVAALVLGSLAVGGYAEIEGNTLGHGGGSQVLI